MTVITTCPDPKTLGLLAKGNLPPGDVEHLETHLAQCPTCLDAYIGFGQREPLPAVKDCHLVEEVGRGRFGVVYKAWSLKERPRIVALKLLNFSGGMERERFEREIKVLKRIRSPHIVKCLDTGWAGNQPYYFMELVEGVHMDEYLASNGLTLNEKLAVFEQVCHAVADAHAKNVIHRDLKPKNILIDADAQPRILDFGICTMEPEGWNSSTRGHITRVGDIIGTLKYMSPEQAWGGVNGRIDKRSDVWALGIMLYEIVTDGEYPYDLGPTHDQSQQEALLERIRKEMPRRPRLDAIDRGRDLEVLLSRCLAWEQEQRLDSAAQIGDDLNAIRTGKRIRTKPLSLRHRVKRLATGVATRSRWAAWLFMVAGLAAFLWTVVLFGNVRWQATGYAYHTEAFPKSVGDAVSAADHVVIVGVTDDTPEHAIRYAAENGIDGVGGSIATWRAVHGVLMKRLARAHPRMVIWDYYFRTPREADSMFVEGVRALREADVPVVLASLGYNSDGTPDLSPGIIDPLKGLVHHGAILARDMVERPGEFIMAYRVGGRTVVPGLALASLAAALHPECQLDLEWRDREHKLKLLYESSPGAYLRERDSIALTKSFKNKHSQYGIPAGQLLACTAFPLERPERWQERTISYETLLHAGHEEITALVRDKILIVGDLRNFADPTKGDRHRVAYGSDIVEDVPGCFLLGDAFAGLLDRRYLKSAFPLRPTTFLLMLVLAVAGCWIPISLATRRVFESRRIRRILGMGAVGIGVAAFGLMTASEEFRLVHVGMAGIALLAPMCGSFWIEFARNRHLVPDREIQAVQSLQLSGGGTITIR